MKKNILVLFGFLFCNIVVAQNPLVIPPVLTGTTFNLTVQNGITQFYPGINTSTYGVNGALLAPTLIVNKWDWVTFNVTNSLTGNGNSTTMHWHGLHLPAMDDGGPHQIIKQGTTWSPKFRILNNASTFWYHPHGLGKTDLHVSKGLAGLIIVKDSAESALNLPRTYGVDDIPIIVQSKSFDVLQQIAIATDMDTAMFVNGTLNPYKDAPAQVVRLRMLNGSSLRTYNFGFSNGQTFYQIATDGGLLDVPLPLTRLKLSPGERIEILADFSEMASQTIYLKSFASELPKGIYGAKNVGDEKNEIHEYKDNFLNGADFNVLQINITTQTNSPVTTIPISLVPYNPINVTSATTFRTIVMDTIRLLPIDTPNRAEGPFGMNNKTFDIDVSNETVFLNTTEIWTLVNRTLIAHPFHIHDIQFNVIEKSGKPPTDSDRGWKDVILVMPSDSVKFITKFEDFADNSVPYMYHCHLLHHEDDGMMASFLVIDTSASGISEQHENNFAIYPNPITNILSIQFKNEVSLAEVKVLNVLGEVVAHQIISNTWNTSLDIDHTSSGIYFLKVVSDYKVFIQKFIKQ